MPVVLALAALQPTAVVIVGRAERKGAWTDGPTQARRDDTYLGWLSTYFLVPEVSGSAGSGRDNQTDRYVGADCADVLVGALRASGRAAAYDNVAGLTRYADVIVPPVDLDDDGKPPRAIDGVAPGDVIRSDYLGPLAGATPRSWDHVAVLWQDRSDPAGPHRGGPDGQLDGFDIVVHMGHPQLVIEPLARQAPRAHRRAQVALTTRRPATPRAPS